MIEHEDLEYDWRDDPPSTLTLTFVVKPRDVVTLPGGHTMFYNARITRCDEIPSAVGQVRDMFQHADGRVEMNASKNRG